MRRNTVFVTVLAVVVTVLAVVLSVVMMVLVVMMLAMSMTVPAMVMRVLVSGGELAMAVIGARFRFERKFPVFHLKTQLLHHIVKNVVRLVTQAMRLNLETYMTIAQMICGARDIQLVFASDKREWLSSGPHHVHFACAAGQTIAIFQRGATFDVNAHNIAIARDDAASRSLSRIEIHA